MTWRGAAAVLIAVCALSSSAVAQVDTPTETPVPATATDTPVPTDTPTITNTPTRTPTSTPTLNRQGAMALQYACPTETPSCDVRPGVKANHDGYKTVALTTTAGSGTSSLKCVVAASHLAPEITLATMSGATCSTAANCLKGFWESCDELFVSVPGGATVSAWYKAVSR